MEALANRLILSILLNDHVNVMSDIIRSLKNFSYNRKNNEANIFLVWMAFEEMNACLERSLHWGDKHDFEVDLADLILVALSLKFSNCVKPRVVHAWVSLQSIHLF